MLYIPGIGEIQKSGIVVDHYPENKKTTAYQKKQKTKLHFQQKNAV